MKRDEMTKALVTYAEVEALVTRNLCAMKQNDLFYTLMGTTGSSDRNEDLTNWNRVKDFIDVGAISKNRVDELVDQILVKEAEKELLRIILKNASEGKLDNLLNETNILEEDVIRAVQGFLDELRRNKKETDPGLKSVRASLDESDIQF